MNVQRCAIFATIVFGVRAEAFQKLCQVGRNEESTTAPCLKQLQGIFLSFCQIRQVSTSRMTWAMRGKGSGIQKSKTISIYLAFLMLILNFKH